MTNIGVFDSGVGGLWILKHLQAKLPDYNYIFFGDQIHVPYGERQLEEIKSFSEEISRFLINKNCQIIVIACNTASAAALKYLREKFPETFFIGMEPAIKPAVEITHTGRVGVLATPATFQGELYNSVVERFALDVEIFKDTCPGLVEQIEKGELEGRETQLILEKAILPMLEKNIDTIVLGCTHYPFVIGQIKEIVGEGVNVIDPTSAIVRRVIQVLNENNLSSGVINDSKIEIFTSNDIEKMKPILLKIFNDDLEIKNISWGKDSKLII